MDIPRSKTGTANSARPSRPLRQKKAKKDAIVKLRPTSGHRSQGSTEWVNYRELSTESSFFPLSGRPFAPSQAENRTYTVRLGYDQAVTTDGSGLLQTVISNTASSAQNWSSYSAVFDEHRVLAMSVQFEPLHAVGGTTQSYWAPIAHVTDRSDAIPLTGYSLAERYESHRKSPGSARFAQKWNMSSVDEAEFRPTNSTNPNAWVKFYSSGNSLSFTVGRLDVRLVVQFRGLGIN